MTMNIPESGYVRQRLELIQARLRRYREAENSILSAQSYSVEGLTLTRADLSYVQGMIAGLEREEMRLLRVIYKDKRSRIRYVIPMDRLNRLRMTERITAYDG